MAHVQIFLSTVSAEFRSYRDALRPRPRSPKRDGQGAGDFIATGTETLDKLDDYIRECDAVIHLVGDMTGTMAQPSSLAAIRKRYPDLAGDCRGLRPSEPDAPALSYTQWEAWLALYHGKVLIIAVPQDGSPRRRAAPDEDQRAAQQAHLQRLQSVSRYPEFTFANADRLAVGVMRSALLDILVAAGLVKRPANLPNLSIGVFFKAASPSSMSWRRVRPGARDQRGTRSRTRAQWLGRRRQDQLALEYAWRRARDYAAKLSSAPTVPRPCSATWQPCAGRPFWTCLSRRETDEVRQYEAVSAWLCQHPGWLLILDNIDSEEAAAAVEALLPRVTGVMCCSPAG